MITAKHPQARKAPKAAPLASLLTRQSAPHGALIHCSGGPCAGQKLFLNTENDISTLYMDWAGQTGRYKGNIYGLEWQAMPAAQARQPARRMEATMATPKRTKRTQAAPAGPVCVPEHKQDANTQPHTNPAQAAQDGPGGARAPQDGPTPYRPPDSLLRAAQAAQEAEQRARQTQAAPGAPAQVETAQERAPRKGEKVTVSNSHIHLAAQELRPGETAQEANAREAAAAAHRLDGEAAAHVRAIAQEAAQEPAQVAAALARAAAQEAAQAAAQAAELDAPELAAPAGLDAGPLEPAGVALAWAAQAAELAALAAQAAERARACAHVAAQAAGR